jgi:membrane associated rhomboid family serine protease
MYLILPSPDPIILKYSLIPLAIKQQFIGLPPTTPSIQPAYLTLITAMFLHGGFLHIASNMLFLWIFGNNVEDVLGRFKYLVFYLLCGITGSLLQMSLNFNSDIPNLGASGAISGVLGSYLILFPNARVLTVFVVLFFIEIARLPAFIIIGFWFLLQVFSGLFSGVAGGGVAYFAHIGGFIAGLVMTVLLTRRRPHRAAF